MFRSYPGRLAGLHPQAQRDPLAGCPDTAAGRCR
jgi:hypothetical protein